MMKRITGLIMMCILLAVMPAACAASEGDTGTDAGAAESTQSAAAEESEAPENADASASEKTNDNEEEITEMKMTINDTPVKVSWENNESVKALAEMAKNGPVTIETQPYGGFEQVGSIGMTLPSSDTNISTKAGDIMLYTGSQMVIFYGSNSWAYTRLGKITDKSASELKDLLGGAGVTVTVTAE